jgi:AP-1 complex subunit gamma-1
MTVFDEEGIQIVFKMKKGEDDSDTIIKAIITNTNTEDVEEFNIQAAVPKYMKVQVKPISDPIVPGNGEDISTQLIRVKNNAFGEVEKELERNL